MNKVPLVEKETNTKVFLHGASCKSMQRTEAHLEQELFLTAGSNRTELLRCKGCNTILAVWRDGALAERRIGPNRLE